MPWYYAGLDAQPVGPIALEELKARRLSGVISAETYVIEYTGLPSDPREWKRYRELFPPSPTPPAVAPVPPPVPVVPPIPFAQPHPLFPSAAPTHAQPPTFSPATPHLHLPSTGKNNPWCSWGFGLGLASLILLLPSCGLAVFLALPAIVVSIIGLVQVQHNRAQAGRNLALTGLFLSGAALLITVIVLIFAVPAIMKGRGQITATEQSTNDSE